VVNIHIYVIILSVSLISAVNIRVNKTCILSQRPVTPIYGQGIKCLLKGTWYQHYHLGFVVSLDTIHILFGESVRDKHTTFQKNTKENVSIETSVHA
jgi:hypothetical protein